MDANRIGQTFSDLKARGQVGLIPFLPAGYPDLATTAALIPTLESAGANVIEIGLPFSDPVADGPTIQQAFTAALKKKVKVAEIFAAIRGVRPSVKLPLIAMMSYSIVFRHGVERFIADARESGFDGLIIPDLPPPEAQKVCSLIRAGELDTILLVAPTTAPERQIEIAGLSSGFVYYLSVSGITGERDRLPPDLIDNLKKLRKMTQRPLCVGFGISRAEHLAKLSAVADGVIVGSAYVKRIQTCIDQGLGVISRNLREYTQELLSQVRLTDFSLPAPP